MSFILALDVSIGKSYQLIYEEENCLLEGTVEHTQTVFNQLLTEIQILPELPAIIFEATGIYSRPVEAFCQRNQFI